MPSFHTHSRVSRLLSICAPLLILSTILSVVLYHGLSREVAFRRIKTHTSAPHLHNPSKNTIKAPSHKTQHIKPIHSHANPAEAFANATRKGEYNAMMLSAGVIRGYNDWESQYKQYSDLETHGWTQVDVDNRSWQRRPCPLRDLANLLLPNWPKGIGMSIQPPRGGQAVDQVRIRKAWNPMVACVYKKQISAEGGQEKRVNGGYVSSYNIHDGILIAHTSLSAWYNRPASADVAGYPDLHYWSDVAYLVWKHECETYLQEAENAASRAAASCQKDPNIVVESAVDNPIITDFLLEIAHRLKPHAILEIPDFRDRIKLDIRNDQQRPLFFAALRSVLGSGVTRLFVDHAHEWGPKHIHEIWVYSHQTESIRRDRREVRPTIVFRIENTKRMKFGDDSSDGGGGRDAQQEVEELDGAFPADRPPAAPPQDDSEK